jgi:hypothetical protein
MNDVADLDFTETMPSDTATHVSSTCFQTWSPVAEVLAITASQNPGFHLRKVSICLSGSLTNHGLTPQARCYLYGLFMCFLLDLVKCMGASKQVLLFKRADMPRA